MPYFSARLDFLSPPLSEVSEDGTRWELGKRVFKKKQRSTGNHGKGAIFADAMFITCKMTSRGTCIKLSVLRDGYIIKAVVFSVEKSDTFGKLAKLYYPLKNKGLS